MTTDPSPQHSQSLTHIDADGKAHMVDVGQKEITTRRAVAEACVRISSELADRINANDLAKGNLLEVAKLAGVMAAKKTDELIPLCHSLPLDVVHVDASLVGCVVKITAEAKTTAKTGVEMEALTAVSVAALTVIDMGKAIDKSMVIQHVRLLEKTGGRSGHYIAPSLDNLENIENLENKDQT